MIRRKHIFFIFWVLVALGLILFSVRFRTSEDSIVAVVEPQRVAISYPKAVKLQKIYVVPGQKILKGDTLFIAERPELLIETDQTIKSLNSARTELKNLDLKYKSEMNILEIERDRKMDELNKDIEQIKAQLEFNRRRMEQLKSVSADDIMQESSESPAQLKMQALENEKVHLREYYQVSKIQITERNRSEVELMEFKIQQLEQELRILKEELKNLIQVAKSDGTIGNLYVQTDEIVSPYTNILSIYESNPNIIKAFLHEDITYQVEVGSIVRVESSKREYHVEGEIIEIGSRIIDYPDRLLNFQEQELYGQEIFIRISEESNFLNGEKVYVSVKN